MKSFLDNYDKNRVSMPIVPLRGLSIFPNMIIHFDVGRLKSIKAIELASMSESNILLVTQKDATVENPSLDDFYHWGTVASIKQMMRLPNGGLRILIEGLYRGHIESFIEDREYFEGEVDEYRYGEYVDEINDELKALVRLVKSKTEEYVSLHPKLSNNAIMTLYEMEDPGRLSDAVSSLLLFDEEEYQDIIKELDIKKRLEYMLGLINRELDMLKIEEKISVRVRNQMNKFQKDYFLREQIKAIKKELGEEGDSESELMELGERIDEKDLPNEVREKALKELSRLSQNPYGPGESGVIRNYLDWILELPWNESSDSDISLSETADILDKDHYGLEDIKERIVEYLAVKKLNPESKGNILLLVGPPGVGKTSIAKSIAHSLNREFVRMSLGGMRDEAEIRGHRRTYIGAMPGRIIAGIKKAGVNNPVFLLDEIDKLASDFRGDPASALLEVLDPEQNKDFTDHYLDLPFDLSQVLFITTANSLNIPDALLDRMEIIRISGYTDIEKENIANRYLVSKQIKNAGLKVSQIKFTPAAIRHIIEYYTRESGVRELERMLAKIIRKAAVKFAKGELDLSNKISIGIKEVEEYLGARIYSRDILDKKDRVGVVNGLAWTSVGGVTLQVEAIVTDGKGRLTLTGKLGEVMKESAVAAIGYLRKNAKSLGIDPEFYYNKDIHIHVPEGAVPKDGPSAGVTMATAVYSALSGKMVDRKVAMTGEITLTGRVLPIGGVKEKLLAAKRMGVTKVILPEENKKDLDKIGEIIDELNIILVKDIGEVLKNAIK